MVSNGLLIQGLLRSPGEKRLPLRRGIRARVYTVGHCAQFPEEMFLVLSRFSKSRPSRSKGIPNHKSRLKELSGSQALSFSVVLFLFNTTEFLQEKWTAGCIWQPGEDSVMLQ